MDWPTIDWPTIIVGASMIAVAIMAYGVAARRIRSGQPLVPLEPRRDVPWRFGDLLMVALFYLLVSAAIYNLLGIPGGEAMTAEALAATTATSMAANLAATGFALSWIFSHSDATWSDFGWRRDTVRSDVRIGLWTFGAVAAPIYGLQAALSPLAGKQHPIIEVLARERTPLLYLLTGLSAVLVAPLAEEFFFRVLLQGWLEAATARTTSPEAVAAEPLVTHSGGLAIFTSALVFASMHVGHGADPIPLFFLALMLGYLYRRTHRLLPCVAVHFCLNACSYLMLCLSPTE